MIRKHRFKIFYITIISIFIVYLVFANFFVLSIFSKNPRLTPVNQEDFLVTSHAHFFPDSISIQYHDVFDNFSISGFLFVESEFQSEFKSASIVLAGTNQWFYSPLSIIEARRNTNNLINVDGFRIGGYNNVIIGEFSSVQLPNDSYELLLHTYENETTAGFARTGVRFIKDRHGFRICRFRRVSNFDNVQNSDSILGNVDRLKIYNNVLFASGWFVEEGMNTLLQNIYIVLTNDNGYTITYKTRNRTRRDVVAFFDEPQYRYSGFDLQIPLAELYGWNKFNLSIIIENENQWLSYRDIPTVYRISELTN